METAATPKTWQTSDRNQVTDIKGSAVHKGPREAFQFMFHVAITFFPPRQIDTENRDDKASVCLLGSLDSPELKAELIS